MESMSDEPTYRVRVGDDGRWLHTGDNWIAANKVAIETFNRTGHAQIFASRGDRLIGVRNLRVDPNHRDGSPLITQQGDMF